MTMTSEEKFLKRISNNVEHDKSSFIICPKLFYKGLSEDEVRSMQQIYNFAYENAKLKVQNDNNSLNNNI